MRYSKSLEASWVSRRQKSLLKNTLNTKMSYTSKIEARESLA